MKKLQLLVFICLFFSSAMAQAPHSFKYQAVARNNDGSAITNTNIGLKIEIKAGSISGNTVYAETFTPTSNGSGVFTVNIGEGNPISGDFSAINWGEGLYFLDIAMDATGGNNYTAMGATQLLSVPYSLYTNSIYVNYSNDTLYIGDQYVLISGGGGPPSGTITDYDGNVYETVVIGTQTWMAENLRSLHYSNGSSIEEVYAYDDNESNVAAYGRLYTWDAVMGTSKNSASRSGNICPDGWHIPTKTECETLIDYLGGIVIAGGKMKETGLTYWENPNEGATNESGYSGRGAGSRGQSGNYTALNQLGAIWTTTENGLKATRMALFNDLTNAFTGDFQKTMGYSARCIKN